MQAPTETETLLLKAAISQGPEAIDAWRAWQQCVQWDDIDHGSQRLLPMLHDNLRRLCVDDPVLSKYEGVKKRYWLQNRLLMHQLEQVLALFAKHEIPAMLIKGSALNALGLFPPGLRPMSDLDIVIPANRALEAARLVERCSWKAESEQGMGYSEADIRFSVHGKFVKHPSLALELHWECASQFYRGKGTQTVWRNAISSVWGGHPFSIMSPADHLLLILAHGGSWNPISPVRWVTDALAILKNQEVDWSYFAQQAIEHRLVLIASESLRFLKNEFGAPIPNRELEAIGNLRVDPFERRFWTLVQTPNHNLGIRGCLDMHKMVLLRVNRGQISLPALISYVAYVASMRREGTHIRGLLRRLLVRVRNSFVRSQIEIPN